MGVREAVAHIGTHMKMMRGLNAFFPLTLTPAPLPSFGESEKINILAAHNFVCMIIDTLALKALETAKKNKLILVDYGIGPKYSYAVVEGSYGTAMGTAYFPAEDLCPGTANEVSIANLPELASVPNVQSRSIAVSLINAISQYVLWNYGDADGMEVIKNNLIETVEKCCSGSKIAVVGNMVPLVKKLREKYDVRVLERNPKLRIRAFPDCFAPRIIPDSDVVIITGTTFVNDTIDYVLQLSKDAEMRMLVGPTAGMHPLWLSEYIDIVASLRIVDIDKTAEVIRKGGGRWDFTPYTEDYIIKMC